ncbi:MAG: tetratricopeptide repeat protein [Candidatus Wallbacteria bacterium]|nr:tetratricopeptide repeat protein [Candidatus Wallbacteria bacterium]
MNRKLFLLIFFMFLCHFCRADLVQEGKSLGIRPWEITVLNALSIEVMSSSGAGSTLGGGTMESLTTFGSSTAISSMSSLAVDSVRSEFYLKQALFKCSKTEYRAALDDFRWSLIYYNRNADAHFYIGVALLELGDLTTATDHFTKALELEPGMTRAFLFRGLAFSLMGNYAPAIDSYTSCLKLDDNSTIARFNRGIAFRAIAETDEALADYSMILNKRDLISALINRGNLFSCMGELQSALEDYDKAAEQAEREAVVLHNRALTRIEAGNNDGAVEDAEILLQCGQLQDEALLLKGIALMRSGKSAAASEAFTGYLERNPGKVYILYLRASCRFDQRLYKDALSDLDMVLAREPLYASALSLRGLTWKALGNFSAAVSDFSAEISLNPEFTNSHIHKAEALAGSGKYDEAAFECGAALELTGQNPVISLQKGLYHHMGGRHEDAIIDFSSVIEIQPDCARAYYLRGNSLFNLGRYEEALSDYSRAIELDSLMRYAYCARAIVYEKLNNFSSAQEDWTTFGQVRKK